MKKQYISLAIAAVSTTLIAQEIEKPNILLIVSDDLTAGALGYEGNKQCKTPNIDSLAEQGMRYTMAFCQYPVSGPSRASMMTGYYPHAGGSLGHGNGRDVIGDSRSTWTQYFKNNGYYTARISKIYHMPIPRGIIEGSDGSDDAASWTERFNSQAPEWQTKGEGELVQNNPDGSKPIANGNVMTIVKADGDDLVHSDGKTAQKACELIREHKDKPFFIAVGFVRPHVPFVAPREYFDLYPYEKIIMPKKIENDWDDIPKAGINYRTTSGMKMTPEQEKKAVAAYYACVSFMDAQVGKVLKTLKDEGLDKNTIVIFTSDHGYHLGEHDFWMKVGLMDESSQMPLIIKVPWKKTGVSNSLVELIDLYPTTSELCGFKVPENIQGKSLAKTFDDPSYSVRDAAFSVNRRGKTNSFLLRTNKWAYIQHQEDGSEGIQLYNMQKDPNQFTNLAENPEYKEVVENFKVKLAKKLKEIRTNDLTIKIKHQPKNL